MFLMVGQKVLIHDLVIITCFTTYVVRIDWRDENAKLFCNRMPFEIAMMKMKTSHAQINIIHLQLLLALCVM